MSPTDCEQVLERIELYLDGELDAAVCGEIREHLMGCHPCLDRSEFRQRLKELLAAKCGCDEVPAGLHRRVESLLHETS